MATRRDSGSRTPSGPDERGLLAGRPHWLWRPASEPPWPAMVILHGAGSAKENHADFGRLCAASGWLAVSFDQRGHGESREPMDGAALEDVGAIASALARRKEIDPARVCVRGSSMGGFMAILAAARFEAIAGVVAICPAPAELLRRGLRRGVLEVRGDRATLDSWLARCDLEAAAAALAPKPLLLLHAEGDERVPFESSRRLYELAGEPRRLLLLPGGSHRSVQHDPELQALALRWIASALAGGGPAQR